MVNDVIVDLGHSTTCVADGAEALTAYNAQGADVVVSDWMMPGLDGPQLCQRLRARIGAPYTYFILLTALGDTEHRLAGIQAGADDYLAKPFSVDDMETRLVAAARVTSAHRRQEALLRMTRRFAAEADPAHLVDDLLHEAISLVGGSAGMVTRWDEESHCLLPVAAMPPLLATLRIQMGEGASGRAAESRMAVLRNPTDEGDMDPVLGQAEPSSAVAVPLLHEARLVGTLSVAKCAQSSGSPGGFTNQDAELLELLASTAAAALRALERARLDGVMLAARTAQHELNNQLAVARGYAEMLVDSPDLPAHLHDFAAEVRTAADQAAGIVRQLRNIGSIHEQQWHEPGDTTINLERSQRNRDDA